MRILSTTTRIYSSRRAHFASKGPQPLRQAKLRELSRLVNLPEKYAYITLNRTDIPTISVSGGIFHHAVNVASQHPERIFTIDALEESFTSLEEHQAIRLSIPDGLFDPNNELQMVQIALATRPLATQLRRGEARELIEGIIKQFVEMEILIPAKGGYAITTKALKLARQQTESPGAGDPLPPMSPN